MLCTYNKSLFLLSIFQIFRLLFTHINKHKCARTHTHTNGTTLATYEHKPKGRKAKQVGRDDSHWLPYPLPSVYNNDVQVLQSFSTRCGHLRASVTISRKCGWGLQGSHMKSLNCNRITVVLTALC